MLGLIIGRTQRLRFARLGAVAAALALPLAMSAMPVAADTPAQRVSEPPYTVPFSTLEGKPSLNADGDRGFWLWHDEDGIHLRTTTRGLPHVFSGVIRTRERAEFYDVHRFRQEHAPQNRDRTVVADNDAIRFRFTTYDGMDGLDFRLSGAIFCVQLENNGHEAVNATHLGVEETTPAELPVCFQR